MENIIASFIATFITMPILAFISCYMFLRKVTKNKMKSLHISTDITTLFLISSVNYLILTIWQKSYFWLIALILIVIAMITVFLHWKVKQDIELKKVAKGFWRVSFLLFFVGHIGLTIYGLVFRISLL